MKKVTLLLSVYPTAKLDCQCINKKKVLLLKYTPQQYMITNVYATAIKDYQCIRHKSAKYDY